MAVMPVEGREQGDIQSAVICIGVISVGSSRRSPLTSGDDNLSLRVVAT